MQKYVKSEQRHFDTLRNSNNKVGGHAIRGKRQVVKSRACARACIFSLFVFSHGNLRAIPPKHLFALASLEEHKKPRVSVSSKRPWLSFVCRTVREKPSTEDTKSKIRDEIMAKILMYVRNWNRV